MKTPKHSASYLFGNSVKAKEQARQLTQGKVLCEGCLEELASSLDRQYHYKFKLQEASKKLKRQKEELKRARFRMLELRVYLRDRNLPDINNDTMLTEYLRRYLGL